MQRKPSSHFNYLDNHENTELKIHTYFIHKSKLCLVWTICNNSPHSLRLGLVSGVVKVGTGRAQAQPISSSTLPTQVLTVRSYNYS